MNQRTATAASVALSILCVGSVARADDPDFVILGHSCKLTAISTKAPNKGFKTIDADLRSWGCFIKSKRNSSCVLQITDSASGKAQPDPDHVDLITDLDTADTLVLHDAVDTHWIWVDRSSRTATSISRLIMGKGEAIGSVVCQGTFMTADEVKALRAPKK